MVWLRVRQPPAWSIVAPGWRGRLSCSPGSQAGAAHRSAHADRRTKYKRRFLHRNKVPGSSPYAGRHKGTPSIEANRLHFGRRGRCTRPEA